jgi:hypothetical protein
VKELQPGGIAQLKAHMERATGAHVRSSPNPQRSSRSRIDFQHIRVSLKDMFDNMWGSSGPAHSLPTHHGNRPVDVTVASSNHNPGAQNVEQLILMSCLDQGESGKQLYQDNIATMKSDQKLLYYLKAQYKERRGKYKSLLSLRHVVGIHFTQVSLLALHHQISIYDRSSLFP